MRALRRIPTVLALAVTLLLAGTVAYAAIPDWSGAINGCVNSRTGVLRVIDPAKGQRCVDRPQSLRETPISWNQRGPATPAGTGTGSPAGIASTDVFEGVPCDTTSARPGVTRVRYWGGMIQMFCQRPGDPDIPLTPPNAEPANSTSVTSTTGALTTDTPSPVTVTGPTTAPRKTPVPPAAPSDGL